jgi:HKD family nuclease
MTSVIANALSELKSLLQDNAQIKLEVAFISSSTSTLVELLTWFESRHVQIHLACSRIMDLLAGK